MTISVLSFYFGKRDRGVETWARSLAENLPPPFETRIVSGWQIYHPQAWWDSRVVVATDGRLSTLWCRLITWLIGVPLVVFGHSGPGADDKWNLLCCPNVFVAFSSWQTAWANKFKLPWTRVVFIPHAVDTQFFRPNSKITKTIDVLCVADNAPDKRVGLVARAAGGLNLKIVGSGQPNYVPFSQMPAVYNQARVFCLVPKSHEAFGLVYLEAMACNLPVVAPADPVRSEIIGSAGILVASPEDPQRLAEALTATLQRSWGDAPRQQAAKFSWDKIALQYDQLFKALCSR